MNRILLTVPVVGSLAVAGWQLLPSQGEPPAEPPFPQVIESTSRGWTSDPWTATGSVMSPFDTSSLLGPSGQDPDPEGGVVSEAPDEVSGVELPEIDDLPD